jgi:hypothetical protein
VSWAASCLSKPLRTSAKETDNVQTVDQQSSQPSAQSATTTGKGFHQHTGIVVSSARSLSAPSRLDRTAHSDPKKDHRDRHGNLATLIGVQQNGPRRRACPEGSFYLRR